MKNLVKKVIPMNNGIFSHIDYSFLDFPSSDLDTSFIFRCGMRSVGPPVWHFQDEPGDVLTDSQLTQLGQLILTQYKIKWDKLSRLINLQYDPIHNFSDITTEEIVDSADEENTSNSSRTDTDATTETLARDSTNTTTDALREQNTSSTSGTATRTDNLLQAVTTEVDTTVTRTDNLQRATTHSGSDSSSESGENDVFGFNSVTAVGDRTDTRESSGTTQSTDSIADTGTQTTVTDGSDSENTTNTGTVQNVESGSGSSTKENTGTRTLVEDVDSTNTVNATSTKIGENSAEKHNEYTRSRTLTRNGNIGNITTQHLIAEEIELWRWNFIEQVLDDVKDFITIPVYD